MKKERAALTIEASMVLTLFMFFVLFLLSFNRVYSAQNIVSHATLQAADAISAESMLRSNAEKDDITKILTTSNHIYQGDSIQVDALEKLDSHNIAKIAKKDFIAAIASSEAKADEILKKNGVKDGISGINFQGTAYYPDTSETIVYVQYTVKLQFPILGLSEFKMTKAAKVTNMGKDTFTVTVKAQNPAHGFTSGSVRVKKGAKIKISASPYYGYEFDYWTGDGGGSDNPKKILVNRDLTFIAVFKKANYSVQTGVYKLNRDSTMFNEDWGKVLGKKDSYQLNDIVDLKAVSANTSGYSFISWDEDFNNKIEPNETKSESLQFRMRRSVKVQAVFQAQPKDLYVSTGGNGIAQVRKGKDGSGTYQSTTSGADSSIKNTWNYSTMFELNASANTGYEFSKWTLNGVQIMPGTGKSEGNPSILCILRDDGSGKGTAKANFKPIKYEIKVVTGGNGSVKIDDSSSGTNAGDSVTQSLDYGSSFTISADGEFTGWENTPNNSSKTQSLTVTGNATYKAYFAEPKKYDGSKAAAYARAHYNNYNYPTYTSYSKDCANFVSQCLEAGGLERSDTWKPDTSAWKSVSALKNYLTSQGYTMINNASPDDLSVGDVLVYGTAHVAIVVRADNGVLEVAQHTTDALYSTTTNSWWTREKVMLCGGKGSGGFASCSVIKMNG